MKGHKLLYGAGALMVLGFFIHAWVDYLRYDPFSNSAPFWVWIASDALIWLLPAATAVIAGYVAKKRLSKKEKSK